MKKLLKQKYPMPKAVFVDVDGTLELRGMQLNTPLVSKLREMKGSGFELYLWSARGRAHAERVASKHGLTALFNAILPKPGVAVDDVGWRWCAFVKQMKVGRM